MLESDSESTRKKNKKGTYAPVLLAYVILFWLNYISLIILLHYAMCDNFVWAGPVLVER